VQVKCVSGPPAGDPNPLWVTYFNRHRRKMDKREACATFSIEGEDHTLGNSLRFVLNKSPHTALCGCSVPHPSEEVVNVRVQTTGVLPAAQVRGHRPFPGHTLHRRVRDGESVAAATCRATGTESERVCLEVWRGLHVTLLSTPRPPFLVPTLFRHSMIRLQERCWRHPRLCTEVMVVDRGDECGSLHCSLSGALLRRQVFREGLTDLMAICDIVNDSFQVELERFKQTGKRQSTGSAMDTD
jgi:hypothetical protein